MTLRAFLDAQLNALMERLQGEIERLASEREPEAIHDLRVSIRRLTQALRGFAGVVPKKQAKRIRRELKELMDLAAEVRSRDIALELFEAAKIPPQSAPCVLLNLEREDAITELTATAARWRNSDFAERWKDALAGEGAKKKSGWLAQESAAANARRELPTAAAEYFEEGRALAESKHPGAKKLHTFRLLTKHLRYTLEVFRPIYGPGMERRVAQLKKVQTVLGELNDLAASRDLLEESEEAAHSDTKRLFDWLDEQEKAKRAEFVELWKEKFDAAGESGRWRRYLQAYAREKQAS